ncbi:MAG: energy transducer TonB [Candidatus Eisenbacteria bacterium]|uniref:Energy transducer TonB n=1 Tax=Eiseniibacteriota bacterium TaxID=2212470 RepID=A0A849SNM6_UNCEI|nr:energy transducer TonB [Candidatus Eisenbacteria bacterium]
MNGPLAPAAASHRPLRPPIGPSGPLLMIADRRAFAAAFKSRLSRSLVLACGALIVLFVLGIFVIPVQQQIVARVELEQLKVEILPELILEAPPAIETMPDQALSALQVEKILPAPALEAPPENQPLIPTRVHRDDPSRAVDEAAIRRGRERAAEATKQLAGSRAALDQSIADLSSSLASANGVRTASNHSRQRVVRGGRSGGDLGSIGSGQAGSGSAADLGGAVEGASVAVGSLAPAPSSGTGSPDGSPRSGMNPGVYRSNASLLAVIQRYAAGIQYCYSNELKRDPSLRGKLVVAITVAASGAVTEASVISNSVRSDKLENCALSQIREWRFPPIPEGLTTFQAPFVFTPPN